ncbi:hypothetical protein CO112_02030 [Candidatus Dojkabacteria bacterium CG_4_9_14_3_um_filter_150_Dojkabacteria_WS6_41_13]|uniref:Uncharacterized protein n=1 Tax=Candidatus Dojkabacteria bacterium CG_4_10_14_0_2_um_filter_Dojkabacteria_WS6_41_15 TaxID=2014249 RepID=A0A2M7W2J7_9BACT|nr:MAG: hypothetical protein COX64_01445 [Candidatus Dojkabacteria bacterium CG_4_10_14_0_2_um_filter_Dojkabacteria_WS6_41_15]PJB22875.1 MAG: hypothetical protein CO112_02030 [Candidatus Dojkabacteria bacterium CG_4_9_14_3_um_filter_150_Dojkabacteria_WS6_41_13]
MKKNFFSLLLGLFLITLGVSSLLNSFGYPIVQNLISTFWPLFVIGLAVSRFVAKDIKGGVILGGLGVVAQLNMLGVTDISYWPIFFSLVLIMIGISSIAKGITLPKKGQTTTLADTTFFGGLEKSITDKSFSSGSFITLFGATEVNLTKAAFKDGEAVIDALVAFGGAEIKVPSDCKVELDVTAIFGGASDKRVVDDANMTQTLRVNGYALFGAIEVK